MPKQRGDEPGGDEPKRRAEPGRIPAALVAPLTLIAALTLILAACGSSPKTPAAGQASSGSHASPPTLFLGAIPDQAQDKLHQIYTTTAAYLSAKLGVKVVYVPVTDYPSAVSQFRTGDLDLVWFGGLTGVQAYLQTPNATLIAQRTIDAGFHSLFIANVSAGLAPVTETAGLSELKSVRFTYGSQSSTSGYLMPAYFMKGAGVDPTTGFSGQPGFSGSHDKTIDEVASGTFQAGAVNEQVWARRVAAGTVATSTVHVIYTTPPYNDYHWMLGPSATTKFGTGFAAKVQQTLLGISASDSQGQQILTLFGAKAFIGTTEANYAPVEAAGRALGLIQSP